MATETQQAPGGGRIILDQRQREAIRQEIAMVAYSSSELHLYFDWDREAIDRDYIVRKIVELQRCADVLDAIGWQETDSKPAIVEVDETVAMWARGQAVELEDVLLNDNPVDVDETLDALSGLRAIAGGSK